MVRLSAHSTHTRHSQDLPFANSGLGVFFFQPSPVVLSPSPPLFISVHCVSSPPRYFLIALFISPLTFTVPGCCFSVSFPMLLGLSHCSRKKKPQKAPRFICDPLWELLWRKSQTHLRKMCLYPDLRQPVPHNQDMQPAQMSIARRKTKMVWSRNTKEH